MKRVKNFLNTKLGLFDDQGRELIDTTPVAIPVGFKRPATLPELLQRLHSDPRYHRAVSEGLLDSVEDADDFGEDGDDSEGDFSDRKSPHEYAADQVPLRQQLRQRIKEKEAAAAAKAAKQTSLPLEEDYPAPVERTSVNPRARPASSQRVQPSRRPARETFVDSEGNDDDL